MSDNDEPTRVTGYLAAFAIGALVGTGVALLYAPHSGKVTRALLVKTGRDLRRRAADKLDEAKDYVHDRKSELVAAVTAGQEAMRDERARNQKGA